MKYKEYIDLGFVRTDFDDSEEINRTGYGGFSLEKELKEGFSIIVDSEDLQSPRLYIEKEVKLVYHIVSVSPECVVDLCVKFGSVLPLDCPTHSYDM